MGRAPNPGLPTRHRTLWLGSSYVWSTEPILRIVQILGLGVDLADIERVGRVLDQYPRFADRCFTEHEREYAFRYAKPERRLAARFAGKEAVMKSMGTGWRRIRWQDIEITGGGKPTVRMQGSATRRAEMLGVTDVLVTITHTDISALVMAVAVGEHD